MHPDNLGSTNVVTDTTGNVIQALDYYPYGSMRINSGTEASARKYIGQFTDGTSLNYLNARYYDSSRGQFLSQDPVFWGKQNLQDPQSLNSYSYAENNPITLKDELGLAATVAQQIQILQLQISILTGILSLYTGGYTQEAKAAYTTYQTAFGGSSGSSPAAPIAVQSGSSFSNWPASSSGGTSQMPNITATLNNDMQAHASDFWINNPFYFRDKVKNHGDWDLKNTDTYSGSKYSLGFVYDGQHISSDAPGNIHYGYVGSAPIWSSPGLLLDQAGKAQEAAGTSLPAWQNQYFHGDDPSDQINIIWGISQYYNR
jgi:RHS repeat-associated protein